MNYEFRKRRNSQKRNVPSSSYYLGFVFFQKKYLTNYRNQKLRWWFWKRWRYWRKFKELEKEENESIQKLNEKDQEELYKKTSNLYLQEGKRTKKKNLSKFLFCISIEIHQQLNGIEIKRVVSKFSVGDKVRIVSSKKIFEKGDAIKNSKSIYVITHVVGNKYKLKNLATGATGDKLFNPRNLLKVTDVDEINKVIEPKQTEAEKPKFIGTTIVKTRKKIKI